MSQTRLGRFAIFIDGANFYHTIRELGLHVDYQRLLAYFSQQGWLVRASYYTALLEGTGTPDWLVRLVTWLSYNGYHVVTRKARLVRRRLPGDPGGSRSMEELKGNIEIELAVGILALVDHLDTVLLFSGDGDYLPVLEAVQRKGTRVIVVSSEKTAESTVADELRRQADEFIDIISIVDHISMLNRL